MTFHFDLEKIRNTKTKLNDSEIAEMKRKYEDSSNGWNSSFAMDGFVFLDPTISDLAEASTDAQSNGHVTRSTEICVEEVQAMIVKVNDSSSTFEMSISGSEAA
ncbi:hypothetical protein [Levilactobacillus yiduensis]|uniref:hypothetical protein n=1 Tax=Levilactobacillus yiduensis TaxID=2953880 RepID=UPI0021587D88|nr:hypothetical protein [Levilactobacillus yiduensis]